MVMGSPPTPQIPIFAVGYVGWKTVGTLKQHLDASPNIRGALIINPGIYVSKSGFSATGPFALWGLICDLHMETNKLQSASTDPSSYLA